MWLAVEHQLSAVGGRILLADAVRKKNDARRWPAGHRLSVLSNPGNAHVSGIAGIAQEAVPVTCGLMVEVCSVRRAHARRSATSMMVTMEEVVARRPREHGSCGWGPANGLDPLLGRQWPPASCLGRAVRDARLRRRAINHL